MKRYFAVQNELFFIGRFFPYPCIKAPTVLSLTLFMTILYII